MDEDDKNEEKDEEQEDDEAASEEVWKVSGRGKLPINELEANEDNEEDGEVEEERDLTLDPQGKSLGSIRT